MMLNSLLIIPENNLISTVADKGKPLRDKIAGSSNKKITEKYVQLSLFDVHIQPDIQQRLIDNKLYYTHTKNLIDLLEDVDVISFDSRTDIYKFRSFMEYYTPNPKLMIGQILGYTAEGIVVRECNSDVSKNAKWANIARLLREDTNPITSLVKKVFWYPILQNPNHYHAIGTGLATTKNTQDLRGWYSRQSERDICWIDSATKVKELLVLNNITKGKLRNAGIQLKVSTKSEGGYVTQYFKNQSVHSLYPVVYFDLGGDYYKVKHKLLNLSASDVRTNSLFSDNVEFSEKFSRSDIVEMMLHRGRDIDQSLHDELLYYKSVFHELASGKIKLMDLRNNDKVISGLIMDYAGRKAVCDSSLITIPYI